MWLGAESDPNSPMVSARVRAASVGPKTNPCEPPMIAR